MLSSMSMLILGADTLGKIPSAGVMYAFDQSIILDTYYGVKAPAFDGSSLSVSSMLSSCYGLLITFIVEFIEFSK